MDLFVLTKVLNWLSRRLLESYEEIIEEVISSWEKPSESIEFKSKKNICKNESS